MSEVLIGLNTLLSPLNADYKNVLAAADADGIGYPSPTCLAAQNTLLASIKTAIGGGALSSTFDQIKVMKGDGPSRFCDINWVNPSIKRTVQVNNILYTPLKGFTQSGLTLSAEQAYLNMGKMGPNFTQNNGEMIFYYSDMSGFGTTHFDGMQTTTGTTTVLSFNPQSASNTVRSALNESAFHSTTGYDLTDGLYFVGIGSGTAHVRKGSASRTTYSATTTGFLNSDFYIECHNNDNGTVVAPNGGTRQCGLFIVGRELTTTEEADIKTAWDTYLTAISGITYPTIGTKYNVSSWSNLNDFTQNGCTASISSNKIHFTGGANTFTQSLDLTSIGGTAIGAHKFSNWTQTIQFVVPTLAAGTQWVGVGIRSVNTFAFQDALVRMELTTGANKGKVSLYTTPSHTLAVNTAAISITAGDTVSITITLQDGAFTISGYNVTTASTPVMNEFNAYGINWGFICNTGHFALFDGGGATNPIDITSWTITINDLANPTFAVLGDSKTQGYKAANPNSAERGLHGGYFYVLKDYLSNSMVNLGGSSDSSVEYVQQIWSIINWVNPKYLIIGGVVNDVGHGTWPSPGESNISSIISQCQAAGIKVIFSTGLYNIAPDQSDVSSWANAGIGCDVFDSNSLVLTLSDAVHPDNGGCLTFARYMRDFLAKYPK